MVQRYLLDSCLLDLVELDMRLSVVGFPTAEADTVLVCSDRWTLAVCRDPSSAWLYLLMMTASQSHVPRD